MKNLERAINEMTGGTQVKAWEPIREAARLDNDAARAEGYRQGVEDGITKRILIDAGGNIVMARQHAQDRNFGLCRREMILALINRNIAFRGARGIDRVEIRQRLERMEKSDG